MKKLKNFILKVLGYGNALCFITMVTLLDSDTMVFYWIALLNLLYLAVFAYANRDYLEKYN